MRAAILVVDTDAYLKMQKSRNSEILKRILERAGFEIGFEKVLPSDRTVLLEVMKRIASSGMIDLILTVGSTGIAEDDIAPEATKDIVEKELPGIPEAISAYGRTILADCMMTRETAGIYENTLIVNLSGETEWMAESAQYMMPEFIQGVKIIGEKTKK